MARIIGHGIDLVEVSRIRRMIEEHGDHFVERVYGPPERLEGSAPIERRAEHYAVRFACKEAVVKAMGTGFSRGIAPIEIQTHQEPGGRPFVVLSGACAKVVRELGITRWDVALTHTAGLAMASAIASAE